MTFINQVCPVLPSVEMQALNWYGSAGKEGSGLSLCDNTARSVTQLSVPFSMDTKIIQVHFKKRERRNTCT